MKSNYVLLLPLWTEKYINLFFECTFKSLLQNGNINFLFKNFNSRLVVCTTSHDKEKIIKKFNEFKIIFNYDFCLVDKVLKNTSNKKSLHRVYLEGFKFEKRNHKNINFILLTADDVFSSNCLRYISFLIKKKKNINCILENKIIVNYERFKVDFLDLIRIKKNIGSSDLIKLALKNIDDFTKFSNVKEKIFNYSTYQLIHWVNKHNLLMHGYLLHPFLVRPNKQINKMKSFFDYYLVPEYIKNFKNIFIIKDSKKFARVGLSNKNISNNLIYKYNTFKFANTLKKWITFYHYKYSYNSTLFSSKKIDKRKLKIAKLKILNEIKKINLLLNNKFNNYKNHRYWNEIQKDQSFFINLFKLRIFYPLLRIFKKLNLN